MYIAPWDYTSEYQKRCNVIFHTNNALLLLKNIICVVPKILKKKKKRS